MAKDEGAARRAARESVDKTVFEEIEELRQKIFQMTKPQWHACRNCKHRNEITVLDVKGALSALQDLDEWAHGRQKPEGDAGQNIVLVCESVLAAMPIDRDVWRAEFGDDGLAALETTEANLDRYNLLEQERQAAAQGVTAAQLADWRK